MTSLLQSQSNRYEGQQVHIQNQCWHAGQNNQSQTTTRFSTGISCQHKRR